MGADDLKQQAMELKKTLPKSRYVKRGDLEREREGRYKEEQARLELEREQKISEKLSSLSKCDPQSQQPKRARPSLDGDSDLSRGEDEEPIHGSPEPISLELLALDPDKTCKLIGLYLNKLLLEWEACINANPDIADRLSLVGLKESREYLRPFFKKLETKVPGLSYVQALPEDVLKYITEICHFLQHKEYVKANDAYLRLSIGNAPWPIGVTMVGIHERSARERIHSNQVAHVLNDEAQRKWIQSLKRIMTWCQKTYPPSDITKAIG